MKPPIMAVSGSIACDGIAAISTRPLVNPCTAATPARAVASPRTTSLAGSTSARPASVSTTRRPIRWNSSLPRSRSSSRMDCDSDGWAT